MDCCYPENNSSDSQALSGAHRYPGRNQTGVPEVAIRGQLNKILESAFFVNSDRLSRFLSFTVETVLAGNAGTLKEYSIGVEAYDRRPPYHPSQDSIVRTEARRLRKKLNDYYENEGKNDPVLICFRLGSYAPMFRAGQVGIEAPKAKELESCLPIDSGVAIAILPFMDHSGSPLGSACAETLADELLHEFVKVCSFRVVDRRTSFREASQNLTTPALAVALGAQIIVDGTVRFEGRRLTVTAQFVDSTGFQLWSQRFEAHVDLEELFPVVERIASALVNRVRCSLKSGRQKQVFADCFRFGIHREILAVEALLDEGTSTSVEEALKRCKNAIQLVPQYARAYANVASCYLSIAVSGSPQSARAVSLGKQAVERAVQLEPELMEAHCCWGGLLALDWDWEEAEAQFRLALSFGTHALVKREFALFLCATERFDEGWSYLQTAEHIDAFSQHQKIAYSQYLYLTRNLEEAERRAAVNSMFGPQPLECELYLALSRAREGLIEKAMGAARSLRKEASKQPASISRIAEIFAICGEEEIASEIANEWKLFSPQSAISRFRQARLALAFGHREAALSHLSMACEEREAELVWLSADPCFDALREDLLFHRILSRVRPEKMRLFQAAAVQRERSHSNGIAASHL